MSKFTLVLALSVALIAIISSPVNGLPGFLPDFIPNPFDLIPTKLPNPFDIIPTKKPNQIPGLFDIIPTKLPDFIPTIIPFPTKLPNPFEIPEILDPFHIIPGLASLLNTPLLNILPETFNITAWDLAQRTKHPHTDLNTMEIIKLHGYDGEVHTVMTDDGYFLEMHRIKGSKQNPASVGKPAVLLQHGILSSSIDWVIAGPERGFGFLLADAGYDVWMGNARGNVYSRQHKTHKQDSSDYWRYSWHEMGVNDLPVMIDYILKISGNWNLHYIGHSQGTTSFFVMLSERPEYNEKIRSMHALAPVAYSSHMPSPIFQIMSRLMQPINILTTLIGVNEFKPSDTFIARLTSGLCSRSAITQPICKNIMFMIGGFNNAQMDLSLLPAVVAHVPAGASVNQFVHYAQTIKSGAFRQMDFESRNVDKYGRSEPPSYKLENIKVPVALYSSKNDMLSSPKDVEKLKSKLPLTIRDYTIPDEKFTHLDYLWAKDVKTLLYDHIIQMLDSL